MDLSTLLTQIPAWGILFATGGLCLLIGLLLARKIWGRNAQRLKAALDESAYLAGQWATLGISQSQLVEKLGRRVTDGAGISCEKEEALNVTIRDRDLAIKKLEKQIRQMEEAKSTLTEREVEALQIQVGELQKRDNRIHTLESRLQHLDAQSEQKVIEHRKQVQVLLDRISGLEESGGGKPDEVIKENNRQLTELLKQRCRELEQLRDEFHTKERVLFKLREQNTVLKKGVDELVAAWSKKKGDVEKVGQLKARLAETTEELTKVKRDFEMREVEIDQLHGDFKNSKGTGAASDLAAAKSENDEVREELHRSSAQLDMLLDVIESRDRRVEELEAQISSGSKNSQIQALSQTIADLQGKVTATEVELVKRKEEATELKGLISRQRNEVEKRDLQLSILKSKVGDEALAGMEIESSLDEGNHSKAEPNRVLSESKGIGRRRTNLTPRGKSIVYFGENSAFIKTESTDVIREIALEVRESGCQISILGYSEKEGNEEFNKTLSVRRAEAVREKFEEEGIDASLVIVKGKGEDPRYSGTSESWKARRVEIVVLPVAEIVN